MNFSLIQPILYFLAGLAVASIGGVTIYILLRLVVERPDKLGLYVTALIAIWPLVLLPIFRPLAIIDIGLLSLFWMAATFADRNVQPSQERWDETFFKVAVTSFCASLAVGFLGIASIRAVFDMPQTRGGIVGDSLVGDVLGLFTLSVSTISPWLASLPNSQTSGFILGYLIGGLFSPSVFAIFLWFWKTVLPRPGIDRHLYGGENHK